MLPHSFASDVPGLREATVKAGLVGRILATFRVEEVILYPDRRGSPDVRNARWLKEILDYLTTAPYLRTVKYPLKPSLRYAGLLPPLNIPTHPEADAVKSDGTHYRQALVVASGETSTLEAGLRKPIKIKKKLSKNTVVNLRVKVKGRRIKYGLVPRTDPVYTGFRTRIADSFEDALKPFSFKIAASRLGQPVNEVLGVLRERMRGGRVCVAFGAADRGLRQIAEELELDLGTLFDVAVNFAPGQGVKTIRTEEALAYTLAILNLISL
ncbi:MAG: putative RNA uridine N3 methyltransferase [Candidatus Caldarchaeum sp.]